MIFLELEECSSTNDVAWQKGLEEKNSVFLVSTQKQTKGRGRQGRSWFMNSSENIACSLYLPSQKIPQHLQSWISILAGISVYQTLEKILPNSSDLSELRLKWPNDLYFDQYKLGGILCETKLHGSSFIGAVIGFGMNVSSHPLVEELKPTSLLETGLLKNQGSLDFKKEFLHLWPTLFLALFENQIKIPEILHQWKTCAKLNRYFEIITHDENGTLIEGKIVDLISKDGIGKLKICENETGKICEVY